LADNRVWLETALPVKWIAARVQIGTANGAKSLRHRSGVKNTNTNPRGPSNPAHN
jgi:hypothetical protein